MQVFIWRRWAGKHRMLLQFSCLVMSNSLQPHGLQHARPSCPLPTPGVCSNSYPLSQWLLHNLSWIFIEQQLLVIAHFHVFEGLCILTGGNSNTEYDGPEFGRDSCSHAPCLSHPISSGSRFNGRYILTSGTIDWSMPAELRSVKYVNGCLLALPLLVCMAQVGLQRKITEQDVLLNFLPWKPYLQHSSWHFLSCVGALIVHKERLWAGKGTLWGAKKHASTLWIPILLQEINYLSQ